MLLPLRELCLFVRQRLGYSKELMATFAGLSGGNSSQLIADFETGKQRPVGGMLHFYLTWHLILQDEKLAKEMKEELNIISMRY